MIFIYGTVYNNVKTLESVFKSLEPINKEKSFYYVDSFSSDGTWELLMSLKKKYDIHLIREKSTRGMGRSIAMGMARSSSGPDDMFMYADLDSPFSSKEIEMLNWYIDHIDGKAVLFGTNLCYRDTNFAADWRNLNYGEDWERMAHFISLGYTLINYAENGVWGMNEQVAGYREKRYSKGFSFMRRSFRNMVDIERGNSFPSLSEYSGQFLGRIPRYLSHFLFVPYLYARISGVYTYSKDLSNVEYVQRSLRIIPPSY